MSTTLIARRTRVVGRIETHGDVLVEGRIEGSIVAGGCVTIGVSGVAVSDIRSSRTVVLGIVIGNIEASEHIDVAAGARIVGDVVGPTVSAANLGAIEGRVEQTGGGPGARDTAASGHPPVAVAVSGQIGPRPTANQPRTVSPSPQVPRPTLRIRGAPLVRPARPESGNLTPVAPLEPRSTRATADLPRVPPAVPRPAARTDSRPHAPVPPRPPGRVPMFPRGHREDAKS
jgi:cytoskeletal protein CcmA (bactofilin family)